MYLHCWGTWVAEEAVEVESEQRARDFWIGECPSSLPYSFWWLFLLQILLWFLRYSNFHATFSFTCAWIPPRDLSQPQLLSPQSPKIPFLDNLFFNFCFEELFLLKRHSVYVGLTSTSELLPHPNTQRFASWSIVIFLKIFFLIQTHSCRCIVSLFPCFIKFFSSIF